MSRPSPRRMLILGGGSDIGAAFASRCASDGLERLVLAGRPGGSVDTTASTLADMHPDLSIATTGFDGADMASHQATLTRIDDEHGPFDTVLIAFGALGEPFSIDADPGVTGELAALNFAGALSATLAGLNVLRGEPNARLVVFSSVAAVRPRVGNLVYGSAKAGLDAFARELRAPARAVGVDVIVLRPGFVHTTMTRGVEPAPFATTPDVVANDLFDGMAKGQAIIHSPAALRAVGGVLRALPGPVWRKVSAR